MRIFKKEKCQLQKSVQATLTLGATLRFFSQLVLVWVVVSALLVSWANQAMAEKTVFSVSPRFYATWIESSEFSEPIFVPMGGLSVSVAPGGLRGWDFTLNGLYGEGESDFRRLGESAALGFGGPGQVEAARGDIEFLVRYSGPNSGAYLVAGARYINFEQEFFLDVTNVDFLAGKVEEDVEEIYLAEIGAGFAKPISKSGRHAAFGNVTFGFGGRSSEATTSNCNPGGFEGCGRTTDNDFAFLVDTNVGYQYTIENWLSLSLRYRLIAVHFSGSDDTLEQDIGLVHGVDVAATFRF